MEYLDFELPIKELEDQLKKWIELGKESGVDINSTSKEIEKKIEQTKHQIYDNLTPWQTVQLSRHPSRPYSLDYCSAITDNTFIELHGDRNYGDDKAMIGGLGRIDGKTFMIIGQQKGKNTKERQYRRFGMPNPDGYRKALRLMRVAEKFNIPILTLIDTPGAYPGLDAEERGQGEAIAYNIAQMCQIKVPIICVVIGEGASGGALGIGVGNKVYMMENTWYSVISPESCSSILFRSWEYKEVAAENLRLTPKNSLELGIIDGIIKEPLGGAHYNPEGAFISLKNQVLEAYNELSKMSPDELVEHRQNKFINMGVYSE
ncbi:MULTISPECIES: acetyl-CoA carboxylase carboxyltransferase subunit alpha [unclassified Apibacter]|uniref:acetyl-CoA carboxylase carboxyltransferase subunit alpha n=1 Tax=unclassified Apibacter TaxID=2630820 RepID=UPI00135E5D07|nr:MULTISPECIES: acetyl-CoA carboxylase carboxyltransferase subunit alpha [unclassified Apibacter]MXP05097.1 acetyl-CoA carboxylase carboxyltransferase subunit alpha [Apibacter sp. B3546]MXP11496.1 acetyl-CoA carboxylase carboxyltransferase subunit alpha [Apibacter sp. B3239]